ncbi:MAG: hypothetical protein ACFFDQ_04245 [Candidatus Thorarchaeota archaeon]
MDDDTRNHALVRQRVISWYDQKGRDFPWRNSKNPYHILIGEMLLRRTTATAVSRIYNEFINRYDTPERLASARESTIARSLVSIGLQSTRAKQLRKTASIIVKNHDGQIPKSLEALQSLPGVGNYIASAVRIFAFGDAIPLVDGNVIHLISRVFNMEFSGPSDDKAWDFVANFGGQHDARLYWGIIDLVATTCLRRNPRCSICPLNDVCKWFVGLTLKQ